MPGLARRYRLFLLIVAIGVALDAIAFGVALHSHRARTAAHVEQDTRRVAEGLEDAVSDGVQRLVALRGLFEASEEVTAEEFDRFVERLGLGPGVHHLGYAEELEGGFLVRYARGEQPVTRAAGMDLSGDPVRRSAIRQALTDDRPTATTFVDLVGDPGPGGIQVFLPVENVFGEPLGVVFASFQLDELIGREVGTLDGPARWSLADPLGATAGDPDTTGSEQALHLYGQSLLLRVEPTTNHLHQEWLSQLTALALGLVAVFLAAGAVHLLRERSSSREELDRLHRVNAEKDRFLATVSHELRTPLTSVVGLASILTEERHRLSEQEVAEFLAAIEQEGQELADLVEDLLTLGRLDAAALTFSPQETGLSDQVRRVVDRLPPPPHKSVKVAGRLGRVWADPLRVRQIVRNLYTNALRYGESRVVIDARRQGSAIALSVRNDGPPIPPGRRELIFRPYEGVGPLSQPDSIGLGLSVSRRLARAMGGDLVYGVEGEWSTFTVILPAAPAELSERRDPQPLGEVRP